MKRVLLLSICVALLVIGCGNEQKSFKSIYDRYCKEPWAEVGSDGSYIYIDSNPFDDDSDDSDSSKYFSDAWVAIGNINKELGFKEATIKKIEKTSSLDGIRTEIANGVEISWKYHPDNGMEVIYTFTAN